jgi:hypothetical protein
MARVVDIPYQPRRWALNLLHESERRFIVLVVHRRGGKTTSVLQHLNRDCLRDPGPYAYIAPLRNQAKRIAWLKLKEITKVIEGVKYNESELVVTYKNGATLSLYGADNADALRGIGLKGAALDEYAQMSPIVFSEIVTKCVADTLGYIIILGTPKGKGHFFRIYTAARANPDMWSAVFVDIGESLKRETGQTINNLRQALEDDRQLVKQGLMTQAEFDQEWNNSWEAALKGAIYGEEIAEARKKKRITVVPYDDKLPVHTVWDLGISVGNAMSIGFFQKPSPRETHLIDYYENIGQGMPHYAAVIQKKPYVYAKHWFPHDIKNREKSSGQSLFVTAERLFGRDKCDIVPKISIEDGIDLTRSLWKRLWIDQGNCAVFEDVIGNYVYAFNETTRAFEKHPLHNFASNAADMLRYAAVIEDFMDNETLVARERADRRSQAAQDAAAAEVADEYKGTVVPRLPGEEESDPLPSEEDLARM